MYRESANPPEKPKGPTIGERFGKWWEDLKGRWPGDRIFASFMFSLIVCLISFFASLLFVRHQGDNIYWDSIPAKVTVYTSLITFTLPLIAGAIWALKYTWDLFLVVIGKKDFRELH